MQKAIYFWVIQGDTHGYIHSVIWYAQTYMYQWTLMQYQESDQFCLLCCRKSPRKPILRSAGPHSPWAACYVLYSSVCWCVATGLLRSFSKFLEGWTNGQLNFTATSFSIDAQSHNFSLSLTLQTALHTDNTYEYRHFDYNKYAWDVLEILCQSVAVRWFCEVCMPKVLGSNFQAQCMAARHCRRRT